MREQSRLAARRAGLYRRRVAPDPADDRITLALPKGRLLDACTARLEAVGLPIRRALATGGRRLYHELDPEAGPLGGTRVRLLVLRDADLCKYVAHGAADLGVCGLDQIEEHELSGAATALYRPLDLGIGRCRLAVAELVRRPAAETALPHLVYATKYPALTRRHLEARGLAAEIVELSGALELAPVIGLCDRIVDLVESGETLRQHGLVEVETVLEITARVVVNPASLKLKGGPLGRLLAALESRSAA